ncbi:trypsin-like serine protease [Staphylococcus sp. GDX8P106P-2]|uniref:trypsin-like serine peptidase n=1 Tax=Staphylococcus sp. GDX8P106P-2 TaxID=2804108 RepID=UPI001AEBB5B2|nr:trypsin-like serine protease [Staphylococcus sp. GDX8P106P-2]
MLRSINKIVTSMLVFTLLFSHSVSANVSEKDNETAVTDVDSVEEPSSGTLDLNQDNLLPIEYTLDNKIERVIGTDQRIKVSNFKSTPYKQVVLLNMTFPNGKTYTGSGTMVGRDSVLTAGHNIYSKSAGGWASKIVVYAGVEGQKFHIGKAQSKKIHTLNQWINKRDFQYDLAIIKLNNNLGDKTGILPITSKVRLNESIETSGFPADKGSSIQFKSKGFLNKIEANNLYYDMDTNPGQSGSSVRNANNQIIGVHTFGGEDYNGATRLNELYIDYILHWMGKPKAHNYYKKVEVIRSNTNLWNDLNFNSKRSGKSIKIGSIYHAIYMYNHPNGQKYLSLYDSKDKWIGYLNKNDSKDVKNKLTGDKYNKKVSISKNKICVWNDLDFNSKRSVKNLKIGNVYHAKYKYNHPNGQKYLSLYDSNNKWIGYFNIKDVKILQ